MTEQRSDLSAREKHRLSVNEFLLLDREGAFGLRNAELIDGEVFYMSPKHRPHARTITQLVIKLAAALEATHSRLTALTDVSVQLSEHDCPEPDIVLTSEPEGDGLIPLASVALIVEVADSTLSTDLGVKAALYARAGVPEYWVADVAGKVIHQMWAPGAEGFAQRREVAFGERMVAETVIGLGIDLPA